jgi:hypothetical protein
VNWRLLRDIIEGGSVRKHRSVGLSLVESFVWGTRCSKRS